jgi:hypothetical protein
MKFVGRVSGLEEKRKSYKTLVENCEGKRPLRKPRSVRKVILKRILKS